MAEERKTPLYEVHKAAGARFVGFAGWEMPVFYDSLLAEHEAVRTHAGLFDVSHMGEIEVTGAGALALCQRITTNDASRLRVGQAQYTLWCDEHGGTIDDTLLYRLGESRYLFCVNASNRADCFAWITDHATSGQGAAVRDVSDEMGLLALQGPTAAALISRGGGHSLAALPRFACAFGQVCGVDVLAARTGYTGEDGFELFVSAPRLVELWQRLLALDDAGPVVPAGLGARDTLRLEAALPLYGHELSRDVTPLEAGLGWAVKLAKGDFLGAGALAEQKRTGLARRTVGLKLVEPGIAREGYPVISGDRVVGRVTSGTRSPSLRVSIALAIIEQEWVDALLSVEIRGRSARAERVPLPFYRASAKERADGA
jgi:aminomethyltransferase